METDICTCSKTKADHANALATGACLGFTIDRKGTYHADKERAKMAKIHRRIDRARPFCRGVAL